MERCYLVKDIIRLLIQQYFDAPTLYQCLFVCKFTNKCVDKKKMQKCLIYKRMEDKYVKHITKIILERVKKDSKGDKQFVKRWMKNPISVCRYCETPMFEQELKTHYCVPTRECSYCNICGLFFKDYIHAFDNFRSYGLVCPLKEMNCNEYLLWCESYSYNISDVLRICSFKSYFQELFFKHYKECEAECLICETKFPLICFDDHFKKTRVNFMGQYKLVCKKIK